MYKLNKFCNIIFNLRKERGWTQRALADKLGIAPQSISKWECGIGYPDVTLFPIIAEVFRVPIGVLFGETQEDNEMPDIYCERKFVFEPLNTIDISVGNTCIIELYDGENKNSSLAATGDPTFMEFLSVEKENGSLKVCIKNPYGSDICPVYDRGDYQNPNMIRIHTGVMNSDVVVHNYLNNMSCSCTDIDNGFRWVCESIHMQGSNNSLSN